MTPTLKSSARRVQREIVLGIDPGSLITGWGLVEVHGHELRCRSYGTISTLASLALAERLSRIYRGLEEIIERHQPAAMSLEKVFFSRNAQSALKLGQARGVALLAAAQRQMNIAEYSAAEIKVAVVGYGQATKEQVQKMVGSLLGLGGGVRPDAADALAAAICHIHRREFQTLIVRSLPGGAKRASWRGYTGSAFRR